jgi:Ca2+-binding RTX toxin-like protein
MSIASTLERYMLDLINQERTSRGLEALQLEQQLNASAEVHSEWMLAADVFSHTGEGGSSAGARMADAGFDFAGSWAWGENLGFQSERGASGLQDDVYDIHVALMNSSGHRANILSSNYDYVGIGIEFGEYRGFEVVMITQNFARTGADVILDTGAVSPPPLAVAPAPPPEPEPIRASSNAEFVDGTAGNDTIFAYAGNDTIDGGGGNDTIDGGYGHDMFLMHQGDAEQVNGSWGADWVNYEIHSTIGARIDLNNSANNAGAATGDVLQSISGVRGTRYADEINGDSQQNMLYASSGNDTIRGRGGDDFLHGNSGNDYVWGGPGDDTVRGGPGNDRFWFRPGMDRDIIEDFQDNIDVLDLQRFNLNSLQNLFDMAEERNGDVIINFGGGDVLIIENTQLAMLGDDILF